MDILIVDDEPSIREVLRAALERCGHTIHEAADGNQATSMLLSTLSIDLLITDILMPGKRGIELIETVRKERPAIKIIALTGGGRIHDEDFIDGCLKLSNMVGADLTLRKPFSVTAICETVRGLFVR